MSYYMAKFQKDYADEFDVVGVSVLNEEQYQNIVAKIKAFDEYCVTENLVEWEVYFGSNECLTFGVNEPLANYVTFAEINDTTYYMMLDFLGNYCGLTIQDIVEHITDEIPDLADEYFCPECGQPLSEEGYKYCYCDSCGATDIDVTLSQTLDALAIPFIFH